MRKLKLHTQQDWRGTGSDILFLTLTMSLLLLVLIGSRPLFVPDEGRYAEIAREMVVRGDYITPHLNGIKYFEKPILFYWLGAAAIKLGGNSITALRSINAILAILGCLLTYLTGRKLYGRKAGLIAAIVLGTSTLYFVMAHMVSLDLPVTVFLTAGLYGFLLAAKSKHNARSRLLLLGAAAAAALAVLTKGLIGIVFPAMIAIAWMTLMGQWHQLKRLPIFSALFVFLLIAAPWHIIVNQLNPEFFRFYFIEQHFLRYTTMDVGHYQPAWFFIPTLLGGFFPWIVFFPQALITSFPRHFRERGRYSSELFLVIWITLVFAFFSFSKSKLIPYILPVIPPMALLTGRYLAKYLDKPSRGLVVGYAALVLLAIMTGYFLWNLNIPVAHPTHATMLLRLSIIAFSIGTLLSLMTVLRSPQNALIIAMIATATFLIISFGSIRYIDTRTIQPLAETIKSLRQPGDEVITYNQYYQDLPFYLEQRVTILNWQNELGYGMQHQDTREWMIDNDQFWLRWRNKKHRIFMVMSKDEYQLFYKRFPHDKIILLNETPSNVLVTNQPLAIAPT